MTLGTYKEHGKSTFNDFKPTDRIKCVDCGWVGEASELEADATDGEAWSNWICPHCQQWLRPEDYLLFK